MKSKLIVHRKQALHPCAPSVPTGWVKLDNRPMFSAASSNPLDRYRNHLGRQLLQGRIMPIGARSRLGDEG